MYGNWRINDLLDLNRLVYLAVTGRCLRQPMQNVCRISRHNKKVDHQNLMSGLLYIIPFIFRKRYNAYIFSLLY